MKILLNLWSVVSLVAAVALVSWVNHSYGLRGIAALIVFLFLIHVAFRKKTGRWMDADGN